jgi:hypothetical protein
MPAQETTFEASDNPAAKSARSERCSPRLPPSPTAALTGRWHRLSAPALGFDRPLPLLMAS